MREQYSTAQRQVIIDCLFETGSHMTASAVVAVLCIAGLSACSILSSCNV